MKSALMYSKAHCNHDTHKKPGTWPRTGICTEGAQAEVTGVAFCLVVLVTGAVGAVGCWISLLAADVFLTAFCFDCVADCPLGTWIHFLCRFLQFSQAIPFPALVGSVAGTGLVAAFGGGLDAIFDLGVGVGSLSGLIGRVCSLACTCSNPC